MKIGGASFSLPLLAKELTEIAARRRTYITRVVYALLLIAFFLAINHAALLRANWSLQSAMSAMGTGRTMFEVLVVLQLVGICLFLPAFAAGLITQEKERDSLALLFLTELSPWQIILQKFGSGLLAILPFMLIGMPLAAISYAYGGISPETLFLGVLVLFLTCLQVAAFSLLCSAWARTTVSAFVGTYVGAGLLVGAVGLLGQVLDFVLDTHNIGEDVFYLFPPMLLGHSTGTFSETLLGSIPSLWSSVAFLVIARFVVMRRAFAPPRHRLRRFFRWLDAAMQRANRLIGGFAFRARHRALPEDDPIAWRELTRTTLGRPHYLARLLVALEVPTVLLCLWAVIARGVGHNILFGLLAAILGTLAVLSLSVLAANAFVSERVNQTLELLMTTPLQARDIVWQKARMLTRFMWVVAVPVMTVFVAEWWMQWEPFPRYRYNLYYRPSDLLPESATYLLCSVLTLAIYLPIVLWLSLWVGLKMKTRFRAIVTALAVIIAWCVLPMVIAFILKETIRDGIVTAIALVSPLALPWSNEVFRLDNIFPNHPVLGVLCNFSIYAGILLTIRSRCLSRAEHYLRGTQLRRSVALVDQATER